MAKKTVIKAVIKKVAAAAAETVKQAPVERVKIGKLKPAPYNPRVDLKPGDPEFEAIRRSLETFGNVGGMVWNKRTGHVVGGHQRLKVLELLGFKDVEVSVVDLSPVDEKLLNLALNKTGGDWHDDRLATMLGELADLPDVDPTLSGFAAGEIESLLQPPATDIPAEVEDREGGERNTMVRVGTYLFNVETEAYDKWLDDLRQKKGFEEGAVIAEIRRRLKL